MALKKLFSVILFISIALIIGIGIYRVYSSKHTHNRLEEQKNIYYCPMHPDYTSEKPGSCPICGMDLVKQEQNKETSKKERKMKFYRNPMNPEITSKFPAKDAMGMDYVPVYEDEEEMAGTVLISDEKQRLIGVKTGKVIKKNLILKITSPGKIAYDPDLYHAISEYIEAIENVNKVSATPWPEIKERAEMLISASKIKLKQMGLSEEQIEEIKNSTNTWTNLLLPQQNKTIWAYLQIYEYEIGLIKPDQTVEITTLAYPDKKFKGKIKAIDSIISPETRTLRARAEIEDPQGLLKPEMYIDAEILVNLGKKLLIPSDSVLDTGKKKILNSQLFRHYDI